jgi:hypothetical protein
MNYTLHKKTLHSTTDRVWFLRHPFSEDDILTMHELLLTPGIHYIGVTDINAGRVAMKTFLDALRYYHKIGFLTLAPDTIPYGVEDMVQELAEHGLLKNRSLMGSYFATEFDYDCIWIESDKKLLHEPWIQAFFNELHNFQTIIPIIVSIYEMNR